MMRPPHRILLAATLIATSAPLPAAAQQQPSCDLSTLFAHLSDIQGDCCSDIDGNVPRRPRALALAGPQAPLSLKGPQS